MAIAHVQDATLAHNGAQTTLATSAFSSNPTVGNYLVAWAWGWNGNGTLSDAKMNFTDTGGNTWVHPSAACFQTQSKDLWCTCGYAKVASTAASFKVTVTDSSGNSTGAMVVVASEFSGVASSSPLDGTPAGTTGTGTTVGPGAMTVSGGSLVVCVTVDDNTSYGGSTPTGFTRSGNETNGSSFEVGEGCYRIGGASPSTPTRTITSAKWAASQFALLAAAGGGGTPPLFRAANLALGSGGPFFADPLATTARPPAPPRPRRRRKRYLVLGAP